MRLGTVLENCIFHISQMYEFSHSLGRGRVKTPAPAARVEHLGEIPHHESQIMLRTCGSKPSWRIVFSTFRRCMSFHTAWVTGRNRSRGMELRRAIRPG